MLNNTVLQESLKKNCRLSRVTVTGKLIVSGIIRFSRMVVLIQFNFDHSIHGQFQILSDTDTMSDNIKCCQETVSI